MVRSKSSGPPQIDTQKTGGGHFSEMMILWGETEAKTLFGPIFGCQSFQNHFRSYFGDEGRLTWFAVTGYDRLRPYFVDALVNSTHSMHSSRRVAGPLWGCWSNEQPAICTRFIISHYHYKDPYQATSIMEFRSPTFWRFWSQEVIGGWKWRLCPERWAGIWGDLIFVIVTLHSGFTNIATENGPFEDVFPIQDEDIPLLC